MTSFRFFRVDALHRFIQKNSEKTQSEKIVLAIDESSILLQYQSKGCPRILSQQRRALLASLAYSPILLFACSTYVGDVCVRACGGIETNAN